MTAEKIKKTQISKPYGKVDTVKALDLKINHNLSYAQIAELQNVTPNAIFKKIRHLLPTEDTKYYSNNKADIYDHVALRLLSQVDDKRLKKISPAQAVLAAMQLQTNARLERGQSTDNVHHLHADIAKIRELDNQDKTVDSSDDQTVDN